MERQVNSCSSHGSTSTTVDTLASVLKKGVRLWSKDGQLLFRAPKGALTLEEINYLRSSKADIVARLEKAAGSYAKVGVLDACPRLCLAPLSFSQLAHWHLYRLNERRAIRQVASATRIRGWLNLDAFRKSLAEMIDRHDTLRTQIVVQDGVPAQEIAESADSELDLRDLTTVPAHDREAEIERHIEQLITEPIDLASDPLFGIRLLKLCDDEHVIIVAMEHMISDGFSLAVLMRDLLSAYTQMLKGHAFSLPTIPLQFADYAVLQRSALKSKLERHGAHWNDLVARGRHVRFPSERNPKLGANVGWATVPVRIGSELKEELQEWCRLKQTTVAMAIFTAYVALVLRWCRVSEAIVQYVTDGRTSQKIENAIGFFASILYPRIWLLDDDNFVHLLNRATAAYCNAYENADCSYLTAQVPRPEFTRNTAFNWQPHVLVSGDTDELNGLEDELTCSSIRFTHPMIRDLDLDHEPFVLLSDERDEIVGEVCFAKNRFSVGVMEKFVSNFMMFIEALLRKPEGRISAIPLV